MTSKTVSTRRKRARKRLRILIAVGSVVFVLLLGLLIDSALYYGKVHAGVRIAGHSMSGLTRDEATLALRRIVDEAGDKPIQLLSGDKKWPLKPKEVGTRIEVLDAVSEAMDASRGSNFVVDLFHRFFLYFSGKDIPVQGRLDDAKLDKFLAGIAEDIEVPPVEPGLAIDGDDIKPVEGRKGRVVDQTTLRGEIKDLLFALRATSIDIPMVMKDPSLRAQDTQRAVAEAKTMISGPVSLTQGKRTWKLTAEQIAAYMDFTARQENGVATLVPFLSAKKMQPFLDGIAEEVYKKPVNAQFRGDGEQAWVVPAVEGSKLDREKTAQALTEAALKTAGRTTAAAMGAVEPDRTTKEAEAMGIKDKLGAYSTSWVGTKDRQQNVRQATKNASNVILAPGEVYSFDSQVGPRTAERGFRIAPGITGGKLEDQFGGGICQVSTTLFNAVFFAGLEVVERVNHSIYIDHYPKGRDATVSGGGPDFRFRNDTDHYILVRGASDGVDTSFVIYGTKDGRKVSYTTSDFYDVKEMEVVKYNDSSLSPGTTEIKTPGQTGRSITVKRVVKSKSGAVIHADEFVSVWRMIPQEILLGVGKKTTSTTKATSTSTTKKTTTTTERQSSTTTTAATVSD